MIKFIVSLCVLSFYPLVNQGSFEWVKFEMEKRSNQDGKTIKLEADIYFAKKGDMVLHFVSPSEAYILNNQDGELKIYNPETNEVFESVNYQSGSQSATFYYFLKNQSSDMGLKQIGFELTDTKVDGDLLISYWEPPKDIEGLNDIELVQKSRQTIFMGYRDRKGKYLKKVFYYDYQRLVFGVDFPMSITEIDFVEKDSIVSKTKFSAFRFDDSADREMLDYQIPENAKLIK